LRERRPVEYRDALTDILHESERTSKMVDSLMMLARADSGNEDLERVEADASVIVQEAAEQGEKLARTRTVAFRASLPREAFPVRVDPEALRRALLILIDNAVKYTPEGGTVELSLQRLDGRAVISVADTGIGMAEQELPHIFDRFWRADKARSREQGGVGLGLPIARWIVDMHQGEISVTSRPGKGSRFEVSLALDRIT
jgi:signal transduction histidine kinase